MTAYEKLIKRQAESKSILCVGLDTDNAKIPDFLRGNISGILDFNKAIIDATSDLVCAYKLNFAFYEQYGAKGFEILKKTFEAIPADIFTIADAKRGDIGNTSAAYAKAIFDYFGADSITLHAYMGYDSVEPFLRHKDKMAFILALTSNKGSGDFQRELTAGEPLYKMVIRKSAEWADRKSLGYVIGATHPNELRSVREIIPDRTLLIPGIGAQGGDIDSVLAANGSGAAIINVSRDIIYTSHEKDFSEKARERAEYYKKIFMSSGGYAYMNTETG
ncbi:MAG: orotidine-5-phosphate decarboxylase [Bacteroidota bacterium]|nr:orotidine-5-phosphate decarboxylase [Bacteroidota bacterium]